jgi:hypothetical protein
MRQSPGRRFRFWGRLISLHEGVGFGLCWEGLTPLADMMSACHRALRLRIGIRHSNVTGSDFVPIHACWGNLAQRGIEF